MDFCTQYQKSLVEITWTLQKYVNFETLTITGHIEIMKDKRELRVSYLKSLDVTKVSGEIAKRKKFLIASKRGKREESSSSAAHQ